MVMGWANQELAGWAAGSRKKLTILGNATEGGGTIVNFFLGLKIG
jgi:hypothetical protein